MIDFALGKLRPTTSAPGAAGSSMTWAAPSPICEADKDVDSHRLGQAERAPFVSSSITTVLIDGVWALRLGFEKTGMARVEGHGQNCPQSTRERKCCGHYFQRRFW